MKKTKLLKFALGTFAFLSISTVIVTPILLSNEKRQNEIKNIDNQQSINQFKKENLSKTEFVNYSMPNFKILNSINKNKNQISNKINSQTLNIHRFINQNKDKIEQIYKFIYLNSNKQSNNLSAMEIANRYKELPNDLKTFANNFRYKIDGLKQMLYQHSKRDLELWCDEWYWFDLNVYYNPSNVSSYINFLNYIKNDYLNPMSDASSFSSNLANSLQDEDNEDSDIAASLLNIYGCLLKIASSIGDGIINSMLNTLYVAQNNNEGATTHWLFGFIYVGTSLGNNKWWGA